MRKVVENIFSGGSEVIPVIFSHKALFKRDAYNKQIFRTENVDKGSMLCTYLLHVDLELRPADELESR